jgi:hypothetical protein
MTFWQYIEFRVNNSIPRGCTLSDFKKFREDQAEWEEMAGSDRGEWLDMAANGSEDNCNY